MTHTYLEEFKIKWDKRHDGDPYCEDCLESFPLEKLNEIDGYKVCGTCLPVAQKEFVAWKQWLSEQRIQRER